MSNTCPDQTSPVACSLFENTGQHDFHLSVVQNIRVVISSLSLLGSLFVIIVIVLLKNYQFLSSRLILYLSISAFISSIVYMLGRFTPDFGDTGLSDESFCSALGYFLFVVDWMVLVWFVIISVNLILNAVMMKRTEKLEIVYICTAIIFPILFGTLGFIPSQDGKVSYGLAGAWCWIRDINVINGTNRDYYCCHYLAGDVLRFVLWYGPQILLILFLLFSNALIVYKYWKKSKSWQGTFDPNIEHQKKLMRRDVKPIMLYPIIYVITQVFPLINRIANWSSPGNPILVLWIFHVLTSPLSGVIVAFFYVFLVEENRTRLKWSNLKTTLAQWRHKDDVKEYTVVQKVYKSPASGRNRQNSNEPLIGNKDK